MARMRALTSTAAALAAAAKQVIDITSDTDSDSDSDGEEQSFCSTMAVSRCTDGPRPAALSNISNTATEVPVAAKQSGPKRPASSNQKPKRMPINRALWPNEISPSDPDTKPKAKSKNSQPLQQEAPTGNLNRVYIPKLDFYTKPKLAAKKRAAPNDDSSEDDNDYRVLKLSAQNQLHSAPVAAGADKRVSILPNPAKSKKQKVHDSFGNTVTSTTSFHKNPKATTNSQPQPQHTQPAAKVIHKSNPTNPVSSPPLGIKDQHLVSLDLNQQEKIAAKAERERYQRRSASRKETDQWNGTLRKLKFPRQQEDDEEMLEKMADKLEGLAKKARKTANQVKQEKERIQHQGALPKRIADALSLSERLELYNEETAEKVAEKATSLLLEYLDIQKIRDNWKPKMDCSCGSSPEKGKGADDNYEECGKVSMADFGCNCAKKYLDIVQEGSSKGYLLVAIYEPISELLQFADNQEPALMGTLRRGCFQSISSVWNKLEWTEKNSLAINLLERLRSQA